jgi:hypothetical protein
MASADYLLPHQPSLAQATNTRLDSACKHIQQCRVSTDDMMRFVSDQSDELIRNKYRYCIHKDELVVGVGRPWDPKTVVKRTSNSAYPKVISNLGSLADRPDTCVAINMIRFMNHYARSMEERQKIINFFNEDRFVDGAIFDDEGESTRLPGLEAFRSDRGAINTKRFMPFMNDYFAVGFANTIGYAHANSGDTMTSVMIGGLRTVMNGDFEIFAGDVVQFYWSFEKDDFMPNGRRKKYLDIWDGNVPSNVDPSVELNGKARKRDSEGQLVPSWNNEKDAQIRQAHYNLSYGQRPDKQKIVAKIKPYFRDEANPRLMDWFRVFGVAIASARPNEMCDIKISRQSM